MSERIATVPPELRSHGHLDEQQLVKVARALGDPTRLGILRCIARHGEVCCGDLAREFPITAATVTHHLRVLSEAGLVDTRRAGQFIRVRPVLPRLEAYRRALQELFAEQPLEMASAGGAERIA